jgi:hypothetical protein
MLRRIGYWVISVGILMAFFMTGNRASGTPVDTKQRVAPIHVEQFGVHNALRSISQKMGVPIGVEMIFEPKTEPTLNFDFPGGTVADLLNTLVSHAPGYRWDETDGMIHVFRNSTHLPIASVTMSYPGVENKSREDIWEDIAQRPEITAWLEANQCARQELFGGREFRTNNAPISIDPGTMTLAQLLDQVAVKSGVNYWAISQTPGKPCQVSIILW